AEEAPAGEPEAVLPAGKIEGSTLSVKKVEDLPDDFILGMDVSSVLAEEKSGVKYYDFDGQEKDLFQILAENGVTHIRVRIWNDPFDAEGHGYGGGNNDVAAAVEIGRRCAACGLKLIVDFHYSDFWADPAKQMVPKAWAGMEIEKKTEALYTFTKESLQTLLDAGADIAMVQIGNETNQYLCGEKKWMQIQYLLNAGAKAVREVCPEALVAVHFANPERAGAYADYAWRLDYYHVDYDVFASSYYPYWHGTLENLQAVLGEIAETYGKKVMVMETSYACTPLDTDYSGNTIGEGSLVTKNYPYTVQGQANCFRDVVDAVAHTKSGIGVCYWEGAWISVGTASWEENSRKWEEFGSGWASSYAGSYDPEDAGRYYGGSAVDNQCFFDAAGRPLESLRVFNLVRYGNEVPPVPDAVEDVNLVCDLNGELVLPETVNAVMTDDSKEAVPVTWDITEAELEAMHHGGVAKYTVTGTAGGLEAHAYISMVEFNFLTNSSFEDGDLTGWTLEDRGGADELRVENKLTDSLTGPCHFHFWSAKRDSVDFTLEQTPTDLPAGTYKFSISLMGGDAGETAITAYAKVNGETVAAAPLSITGYGNWDTAQLSGIGITPGDTLTVGIAVKCSGEGNGAWGKIDDAMLNSQSD
ncbi:MAG: glycosyl hydrolase 53 family protein, partial [bacterium]